MTETTSLPPRPSSSWPHLVRRRDDKVLAGVCAAAARATGSAAVFTQPTVLTIHTSLRVPTRPVERR